SEGFSSDSDASDNEGPSGAKPEQAKPGKKSRDTHGLPISGTADLLSGPSAASKFDADLFDEDEDDHGGISVTGVHIRIQQRTARKSTTTLQGLPEQFDLKYMLKYFKKTFGCLGAVINDKTYGQVIQLGGDQRIKLRDFLVSEGIAEKRHIVVHGF
ncbi:Eukaryotic translation initiation factor eIF-1, partial [Coemansia biformis]